jgi:hypothetical protein
LGLPDIKPRLALLTGVFLCDEQTTAEEGDMRYSIYESVVLVTILVVVGLSYVFALSGTIAFA